MSDHAIVEAVLYVLRNIGLRGSCLAEPQDVQMAVSGQGEDGAGPQAEQGEQHFGEANAISELDQHSVAWTDTFQG